MCVGFCLAACAGGEAPGDARDGTDQRPDDAAELRADDGRGGRDEGAPDPGDAAEGPGDAGDAADAGTELSDPGADGGDAEGPDGSADAEVGDAALDVEPGPELPDDGGSELPPPDAGPPVCQRELCDDGDPCTEDRCLASLCVHELLPPVTTVAVTGFEPGDAAATVIAQPGGYGWTPKATDDAPEGGYTLYGGNPQASPLGYGGPLTDATAILTVPVPGFGDTAQLAFALRLALAPASPARVEVRVNGVLRLTLVHTEGFETFRVPLLGLAGSPVVVSFRFVAQGGPGQLPGGAWLDAVRLEVAAPDGCAPGACVIDAGCPVVDPCLEPRCLPGGSCGGVPRDCDDGDPCTVDSCLGGQCVSAPDPCDDGDPCTVDGCGPAGCASLGAPLTSEPLEDWSGPHPLASWSTQQPIGSPTWAVFPASALPEPFSELGGDVLYMPRDVGIGGLPADGRATLPLPVAGAAGRVLELEVALATADDALTGDRFEVHLDGQPVLQTSGTGARTLQVALPPGLAAGAPLTLRFRARGAPALVGGAAIGTLRIVSLAPACAASPGCVLDGQCDDGDPCDAERCQSGACQSVPVVCLPGAPCADAPCDAESLCTLEQAECDDGDPCTVDACAAPPGAAGNDPADCSFTPLVATPALARELDLAALPPDVELLAPNGGLGWVEDAGHLRLGDATGLAADYGSAPVLAILRWGSATLPPEATLRLTLSLELDPADPFADHLSVFRDGTLLWDADADLGQGDAPVTVDIALGGPGVGTLSVVFQADGDAGLGAGPVLHAIQLWGAEWAGCGVPCALAGGCDDGDPCTDDACVAGACEHAPRPCDDGVDCTAEACQDGRCHVIADRCVEDAR
ncbi:MAG: hypothetical protein H6744_17045 [Deltaproteobacteria bacterium]|nr:hypothetical protein [Deltaproteobacteria bacterium]